MSKYTNYKEFLKEFFDVPTTLEQFTNEKKITFICKLKNHENSLGLASFGNKKSKIEAKDFCQKCKDEEEDLKKTEEFKKEIKEKCGHNVILVDFSNRKVEYKCGKCGNLSSTFISNLQKENRSNNCPKCQNDKFKIPYEEIKERVEKQGMKLLTEEKDYENNKQKLKVICSCGNDKYEAVLFDITRGKKCHRSKK
jgi:DNA-directed RNA polymerase subunit RPC12/RpoP